MKSNFLFPAFVRPIGFILAIPGFILGYLSVYREFTISSLDSQNLNSQSFHVFPERYAQNLTNELALTLVVLGLIFIAFSRLKHEDELTAKLRLDALYWAVLINTLTYFIIGVILWFVNGDNPIGWGPFMNVANTELLLYNMFTPLIIFITRFYYLIYRRRDDYVIPKLYFLPFYPFRLIGRLISIAIIIVLIMSFFEVEFSEVINNWEVSPGFIFVIPFLIWAYSKNPDEDELISRFRLESMQLSIYLNYGLLIIANLTLFGLDFLGVMVISLISPLIFFILRFGYVCSQHYWQVRREARGGILS